MQKTHGVHTQSEAKDLVGCNGQNSLTDILLRSVNWRHHIKGKVIFHRPILLIVIAPPSQEMDAASVGGMTHVVNNKRLCSLARSGGQEMASLISSCSPEEPASPGE